MNRTTDRNADAVPFCHRDRTKALLAYAVERHVTGHGQPLNHAGDGPWDVWWVCYRTQRTAAELGLNSRRAPIRCEVCAIDASTLASHTPPKHPDGGVRACRIGHGRCGGPPPTSPGPGGN